MGSGAEGSYTGFETVQNAQRLKYSSDNGLLEE